MDIIPEKNKEKEIHRPIVSAREYPTICVLLHRTIVMILYMKGNVILPYLTVQIQSKLKLYSFSFFHLQSFCSIF